MIIYYNNMLCLSQYIMCVYAVSRAQTRVKRAHIFFSVSRRRRDLVFLHARLCILCDLATRVSTWSFALQELHKITLQTYDVPSKKECTCAQHRVEDRLSRFSTQHAHRGASSVVKYDFLLCYP